MDWQFNNKMHGKCINTAVSDKVYHLRILIGLVFIASMVACDKLQSIEPNVYKGCCGLTNVEDSIGGIHYSIPNAISPNNDEINDAFSIYSSAELRIVSLSVMASNGSLGINRSNIVVNGWTDIWIPRNSSNIVYNGLFEYSMVLSDLNGTIDSISGQFCSISCLDESAEDIPGQDCRFKSQANLSGSFAGLIPDSTACY